MKTQDCYYYLDADKKPVGPFSFEEMLRLAAAGKIGAHTPTAREGHEGWMEWSRLSVEASPRAATDVVKSALPPVPGTRPTSSPLPHVPERAPAPPSSGSPRSPAMPPSRKPLPLRAGKPGRGMTLAIGGIVALGTLFLIGLLFVSLKRTSPSVANDEIQSPEKLRADYGEWLKAHDAIGREGVAALTPEPSSAGDQRISWWQRTFELPHEKSVRAALERRLPPDAGLRGFDPVKVTKVGDGVAVNYRVHLRLASSMYGVPVENVQFNQPELARYKKFSKYLIASEDLPPGRRFAFDQKKLVAPKGTDLQLPWTIRRAAIQEGKWKVLDAEPLALDGNPIFEQALLDPDRAGFGATRLSELSPKTVAVPSANRAPVWLLRSEERLRKDAAREDAELQFISSRVRAIDAEVSQLRQRLAAELPARPEKDTTRFGGSGSGEPTKTGVRVGGGAAAGAGIGALAGGGSGAGWGALGGAVAGGIYDGVSKSNDRKRFEAAQESAYQEKMASYNAVKKRIDAQVANRESELVSQLEQELQAKARQQTRT